jgi:hypothetical protein
MFFIVFLQMLFLILILIKHKTFAIIKTENMNDIFYEKFKSLVTKEKEDNCFYLSVEKNSKM